MALTLTGSANAATTSVAIPAHAANDLIVVWTFVGASTTVATKPTAGGTVPTWVDIDASMSAGGQACSARTAQAVATGSSHTTGTWTGASNIIVAVLSGVDTTTPIGGHLFTAATATTTTTPAPAITLTKTDGTSQILCFHGHRINTAWNAAPTGYTRRQGPALSCFNTKDVTTSDGAVTQTGTSTGTNAIGTQIEILAAAVTSFTGTMASTISRPTAALIGTQITQASYNYSVAVQRAATF